MFSKKQASIVSLMFVAVSLTFCKNENVSTVQESITAPTSPVVSAKMESRAGSNVQGTIVLTQNVENQVTLQIDLTGFTPHSAHAFHVHAVGDCSDEGAASAGPHFNPSGMRHGGPDHEVRHAGDMGNLDADANGEVHTLKINTQINLRDDQNPNSAIGKSIIVHQDVDDFETQPTGNAGARVACGIIVKK